MILVHCQVDGRNPFTTRGPLPSSFWDRHMSKKDSFSVLPSQSIVKESKTKRKLATQATSGVHITSPCFPRSTRAHQPCYGLALTQILSIWIWFQGQNNIPVFCFGPVFVFLLFLIQLNPEPGMYLGRELTSEAIVNREISFFLPVWDENPN